MSTDLPSSRASPLHRYFAGQNPGITEEKPPNDVFCRLSAAFSLALRAGVYDSSITTTTPEKPP
jgi:hypothetical protein